MDGFESVPLHAIRGYSLKAWGDWDHRAGYDIRDNRTNRGYPAVPMKMLSLATIGVGTLCLLVAVVEKLVGKYLLGVAPVNYVHVAAALFLLALALMCHGRCCCQDCEKK
jgi:hypothetical protein